jgi:CheY-like chemotaxis protein
MSGNGRTILLIEPNDDARALHADALRREGFSVVAVANCEDALESLSTLIPQLIVASYDHLTSNPCLTFCEQLKADSRTREVPVLLTSHDFNREDVRRATETKALVLSLTSPLDDVKLTSAVRGVLAVSEGIRLRRLRPQEPRSA